MQLLKGSLADVASFRLLSVLATLVCCHQHLSLNRGIAHLGILSPTVSDGARDEQAWVGRIRGNMRDLLMRGRVCAELVWPDAEGAAIVEFIALGEAALTAFPAVDVVAHAVHTGHGRVVGGPAGLDELTGHLAPAPAAGLALLAQPRN